MSEPRDRRCLSAALFLAAALTAAAVGACSQPSSPAQAPAEGASPPAAPPDAAVVPVSKNEDAPLPPAVSPYDALPAESRELLERPFTGDLDAMIERRLIRAGVVYNRTQYFIEQGTQRGFVYEAVRRFEDDLNARLKTGLLKVHIAVVPLTRDQLFPALTGGKVDFVAAALTITPERMKVAAFSNPTRSGVSEIVVVAPDAQAVATADDLSGREVFVRRSSSYYESLQALNQSLASRGKPPVVIKEAPEALEDDDILEMVNAGLVDLTIVDDFVAELWSQVFTDMRTVPAAAVRTGGDIGIGVRKDNPKLLQAANTWIKAHGPRTAFGNTMERRYFGNAAYVRNAAAAAERQKLLALRTLFETYGKRYDVDDLLMAAQGYQESRLDQSAKSHVGAVGVMQVMPATGKELAVGDISQVEPNIHAGVKYFRFMVDRYYKDEPMDQLNKGLMTLASYNAGPGRMRQLRRETAARGLNPNVWFGNVERVVSERIGRETVTYVSNIYKYYVAYRLASESQRLRTEAKEAVEKK